MTKETIETAVVCTEGEQFCTCSNCSCEYPSEDGMCFDNQNLCAACAEELTVICVCCDDRIWVESNAGDRDTPLCQHCYDNHYTLCEQCGALISHLQIASAKAGHVLYNNGRHLAHFNIFQ